MTKLRNKRFGASALVAIAAVTALVFLDVAPASATSANLTGTQGQGTNRYWTVARTNTFTQNTMRIAPFVGTQLGVPSFIAGERNLLGQVPSNAKTTSLYQGQSGYFYRTSSPYNAIIGYGTFYMTTFVGADGGCGCDDMMSWTATLIYNVQY